MSEVGDYLHSVANQFINLTPEQEARLRIDEMLDAAGWVIQNKAKINLAVATGVAVREYGTDIGPADYVLFVDKKPVGVIEAKRADEAHHLTVHEDQTEGYAKAKLKHLNNGPLRFRHESTGDPKPRSQEVFSFHRPQTLRELLRQKESLRTRLQDLPALPEDRLRDCQITAIKNLEASFKDARPRALIQMATDSGKTFTAITFIYRLLFLRVHEKNVLFKRYEKILEKGTGKWINLTKKFGEIIK